MKKHKILLTENIHSIAKDSLEKYGHEVTLITYSPDSTELKELLPQFDAIGIRSKTKLTKDVLSYAKNLWAIGCFCIGTNQVDLHSAKMQAQPVFNAPHSNTRSVAELVIAQMIALSRKLFDRSRDAHLGKWDKSASGSKEVRGKKLGIIGYGHIGSQVSILAEAMGLEVYFYDVAKKLPLGNARSCDSLLELLAISDFVTLHVPEVVGTKNMVDAHFLKRMKQGSYLINASRGSVVVIDHLVEALKSSHIAGAAIDVFPTEPASNKDKFESALQNCENVILTPHIGGSTEEAQRNIGIEVAESLNSFLRFGITEGAVNYPHVNLSPKKSTTRLINTHLNKPGMLGMINNTIYQAGINIEGQFLSTDEDIGYIVMDVPDEHAQTLQSEIKKFDDSLKTRILI